VQFVRHRVTNRARKAPEVEKILARNERTARATVPAVLAGAWHGSDTRLVVCCFGATGTETDTVVGSRPAASRRSVGGDIVWEVLDTAEGMHDE
jgi:hypothetical protein